MANPAQREPGQFAFQPLISVRGLGIRFKTSQGVWQATRKIDFDVAPGERVGIVGESGCGKTITGFRCCGSCRTISPVSTARSCSAGPISSPAAREGCAISAADGSR